MMRNAIAFMLLLTLSACYCMPDKGDAGPLESGYFSGCWGEASKNKGKAAY